MASRCHLSWHKTTCCKRKQYPSSIFHRHIHQYLVKSFIFSLSLVWRRTSKTSSGGIQNKPPPPAVCVCVCVDWSSGVSTIWSWPSAQVANIHQPGTWKAIPKKNLFSLYPFTFRVDDSATSKFRLPFHPLLRQASAILAASEGTGHQSEFLSSARRLCPDQRAVCEYIWPKSQTKPFKHSSPFWGSGQRNLKCKFNIPNTVWKLEDKIGELQKTWH